MPPGCRILGLMPQFGQKASERADIKRYLLASACLGAWAKQSAPGANTRAGALSRIDNQDRYTVDMARRLAEIVLSAVDADDLRQALDEAFGHYEIHPDVLAIEPNLLSSVTNPEIPIEHRELMLASWIGNIAQLVVLHARNEDLIIPDWLNAALARYAEAGRQAEAQVRNLVELDPPEISEAQQARQDAFAEASLRATQSGEDGYLPFGHPDD
jgi:hypothetical protein